MTHLGDRVAALVDGELSHQDRDRALAHIAHCAGCRSELATQRATKQMLASATAPRPAPHLVETLHAIAAPGGPLPPRARTMPQGPIVPDLPPPGRTPAGARTDSRRPGGRRAYRRASVLTAGALSAAGLVLATAFVAGGTSSPSTGPVVPPVAELSVEHSRTTNGITVGDPIPGLMTTFSDPATTSTRR
jgi:anti-sigma factor RsiW